MSLWLMIFGGALALFWGAAHIFPTRSVVAGFGELSSDNRRVLIMEWIAEGLTLIFLGVLVLLVCPSVAVEHSARLAVRACAAMLVALATLSAATGARTSNLPMRLCPLVKLTAAGLLIAGTWG
jgi:hypothetical protein